MTNREQVHITVNPKKKARWKEVVDEDPEYSSLSHLIRRAVSKEISGEESSGGALRNTEPSDSFNAGIDELQGQLETLKDDVAYVKEEVGRDTKVEEFSTEVFEALPDEKPGTIEHKEECREIEQAAQRAIDDPDLDPEALEKQLNALHGTLEGLADYFGKPKWRILRALERLEEETNRLGSIEIEGQRRYYKKV